MSLSFKTFDVFTTTRYTGNPLALVYVPASAPSLTQQQKQDVAKEFNLSETVFLHLTESPHEEAFKIDIFTETAEVPFAGHPTIGTAYHLLTTLSPAPSALLTKAGKISISLDEVGGDVRAEIPHNVHVHNLKINSKWTVEPAPVVSIVKGMTCVLACLPSLSELEKATVSLSGTGYDPSGLDSGWDVGLVATYFYVHLGTDDSGRSMIRSRMWGVTEDPATGSAASALGSYLALQEPPEKGPGPFKYAITQGVEMGRKSEIGIEVTRTDGGAAIATVVLSGKAVGVMEGKLTL